MSGSATRGLAAGSHYSTARVADMPSSIDLPWELWIKILSFLEEFATLTNFSASSTRNRDIVDQSRALLHYRICCNIGYTEACTFGSATTVYPAGYSSGAGQHGATTDFASLTDTIHRQNTMMKSAFKDVKDWKDFGSFNRLLLHLILAMLLA